MRVNKIVFASWNPKKLEELKRMAQNNVEIICLKDIPEIKGIPQAEENGETFLQNAKIKAMYWKEKVSFPVLAEDSGIMIDSLNGYPGVYTKRWIQELYPDANININDPNQVYPLLLKLMEQKSNPSKVAYFVSAMALVDNNGVITVQESVKGEMCKKAGEREFGFDQYFKPDGYSKTFSQMLPEEKDDLSPRKKAFEKILEYLKHVSS